LSKKHEKSLEQENKTGKQGNRPARGYGHTLSYHQGEKGGGGAPKSPGGEEKDTGAYPTLLLKLMCHFTIENEEGMEKGRTRH